MKLDAYDHPKTLDFAARLGVSRPTAIGHLDLFWAFAGKYAAQGNIGKLADGAIARGCDWMGDPETFVAALRDAGFLDPDPVHRFIVHDWSEHCPRWVKSKLKTLELEFIGPASPDTSADTSPDTSAPSLSKARLIQGKASQESEGAHAPPKTRGKSASRIPDDFELTDARRQIAEAERVEPERTFAKFADYWRAASGAKARKLDWDATWRNWCRTEADRSRGTGPRLAGRQRAKTTEELEAMERARAQ